jgi:hypothetical protein
MVRSQFKAMLCDQHVDEVTLGHEPHVNDWQTNMNERDSSRDADAW